MTVSDSVSDLPVLDFFGIRLSGRSVPDPLGMGAEM